MKEDNNISNHNNECLTSDMLIKYIKGELSGLERNRIERHLSSCEMCSDEMEGLSNMENPEMVDEISLNLNKKIDSLTAKPEREIPYLGMYIRVAASIIFVLGISSVIYFTTFRKTPSIMPNYALMEAAETAPAAPDSSNDKMLKDIAANDNTENRKLEEPQKSKGNREVENRIDKPRENVKYVAPVVVDSLVSDDETVVEIMEEEVNKSVVVDELVVAETNQVASESIVQLAPASVEKKSSLALGGVARKESLSADKSVRTAASLTYNERKTSAIRLFSKQKYKEALAVFAELYNDYPINDTTQFYSSMCNYHLNRFNETISSIAAIAKNNQSVFYNEAKWYYALALINTERKEDAVTILEQILQEDSPFKNKAKSELQKIKGN